MKVCIFTHTFPRFKGDTAAPFMGNIAQAFADVGHEVFVLTPFDPGIKTKNRGDYKIVTYKYIFPESLHILGYSRTFKAEKTVAVNTYLIAPFMYLFGFLSLWKLVRRENIDVVNSHWIIPNGFLARLVKIITGVPYTISIPGSDVHMGGKNEIFKQMVGFASRGADYVISDSQHYIDQLNELGFYPEKIELIRYGVNAKNFKPNSKDKKILKSLGLNTIDPVIVCVGRLVEKKGFIYLVRAMPTVLKKLPKAKLVIVGDGYERKQLEEEVKRLKVGKSVVFAGTISYDELSKYYNIADVFVMPSVKDQKGNLDASPVTMMEAMACGVPVVATKFAGSGDLVRKGETGYLVKEKNVKEIASGIINLLTKGTKKSRKNKVRKIAVDNFSVKSVAKLYTKIFKKITKK